MRRTYRSKKETGGGLDPRDVIRAMDEKSSIFDAFYIQNIKQTKRELSVRPSVYVASNKVRKRKYVKRLKEQELAHKESKSGYLTPDKSIHVKKPLDPFDLLLNSLSSNEKYSSNNEKQITRQRKTYKKKKLNKKTLNYSSTTDSDKENCESNLTQDISDVLSHNLLIEEESKMKKEDIDMSITTNLSLLRKLRDSSCLTPNLLPNLKDKLIRQSDQNSPLCSTPFFKKYRGKSIFKFSPISNVKDGYENINTVKTDSKINNENNITCDDSINIKESDFNNLKKVRTASGMYKCYDFDENCSPILGRSIITNVDSLKHIEINKHNSLDPEQVSVLQISNEEPFLGFSESTIQKIKNLETVCNKYKDLDDCVLSLTHKSLDFITPHSEKVNSFGENVCSKNVSKKVETIDKYESQTFLDFTELNEENSHNSIKIYNSQNLSKEASSTIFEVNNTEEEVFGQNKSSILQNSQIHLTNSLEDANSFKVKELKLGNGVEVIITSNDKVDQNSTNIVDEVASNYACSDDDSTNENEYQVTVYGEETFSNFLNNATLYESCHSETFSIDDQDKKLSTQIEYLSDSVFQKSYQSLGDSSSERHDTYSYLYSNEESHNDNARENNTILERLSSSNADSYQDNVINMCGEENTNNNSFESTLQENSCISYITTRKKKDLIKDSFILCESSFSSASSSELEKTVLNNTKCSIDNNKEDQPQETTTNVDANIISDTKSLFQINNRTSNNSTELSASPVLKGELSKKSASSKLSLKTRKRSTLSRKSVSRKSVGENRLQRSRKSKTSIQLNVDEPNKTETVTAENLSQSKYAGNCISAADTLPSLDVRYGIVLEPGKRWERSLSIYRRITTMNESFDHSILDEEPLKRKGRKYRQSVISTMEMQNSIVSLHNESLKSRNSTIFSKPSRSTIKIVRESNASRTSLYSTTASENLDGFLTEDCDDTIVELSKLSIIDSEHEVTVLDKFNDTSNRIITARDYILRRCNQTDIILFDECYPDTVLKNCRKIGEGVYGEVYLWRARDGRARVLKIVPIAGNVKVNGESQKDYHEIISEIVIAMELSALRAPIQEIEKHLDEGKSVETLDLHSVENATDVFNEVLAVRCVYGTYPSRLLDLWELYDECKGSDNDNPVILPVDQQYMVLELANAGQDLESYQFNNAEQAYALFQQVAYGLAVAEEAFQFEHRDLHWGNVLISPTEQKYATFVLRGRAHRVARRGVAATVIDYSLSRLSGPSRLSRPSQPSRPAADGVALYNDLAADDGLFDAVGDYQFEVYRLMREKLGNDWKNFEPYTNILWLHYTVDKMITALRYTRTNTKIHKHYIARLKEIKNRILDYGSAVQYVLIDNEL